MQTHLASTGRNNVEVISAIEILSIGKRVHSFKGLRVPETVNQAMTNHDLVTFTYRNTSLM